MFERSRYNWATTQVEISCQFDFAATDVAMDLIKSFLSQDEIFEMTNSFRKSSGFDWYKSLARVLFALRDNAAEEIPDYQRRLYALIFAACAVKAGAGDSSSLADSYEQFGLSPRDLEESL